MEKTATVAQVRELAPGVRLVELSCREPAELEFQAGQFVSVRCAPSGDVRRSYTIASSPRARTRFELVVKDVPGGVGTEFFRALRPGHEVHFTGPLGFFVPDPRHSGDVVVCVTGVGIAAALPVMEELPLGVRIWLHWGLLTDQADYFAARLDALRASHRATVSLTRAPTWHAVHETLSQHLVALLPELTLPVFYLAGNGDMCRRVRDALVAQGVDRRKSIRNEVFYPTAEGQR